MTRRPPIPIEVQIPAGIKLRGHEFPEDGPPVVFFHDLGADLDVWGSITADVAAAGFRVISLELRGHGLSDGDADPKTTLDDVVGALHSVADSWGPVGLVAYGSVAETAFAVGREDGAPVHVVVSPAPLPEAGVDLDDTVPAMRALIVGANDPTADGYVRSLYPKLQGQRMWFSTGTTDQGPALLAAYPHLVEQLVTFLRRYLTGFHLAWIAEHQISTENDSEP